MCEILQACAQRAFWKILREFGRVRKLPATECLAVHLQSPGAFMREDGIVEPEAPNRRVKEIAEPGLGLESPHLIARQSTRADFKGTSENKMPHRGGIRRGLVSRDMEWIFRFQQRAIKCRGMVFAMGVMGSFARSVNLGNPHLLRNIMPMVIRMVNSCR